MSKAPKKPLDLTDSKAVRRVKLKAHLVVSGCLLFPILLQNLFNLWLAETSISERLSQAFPGISRMLLASAPEITLYSLDGAAEFRLSPTSRPGQFHGYPIKGQVVLRGEEKARLLAALDEGFSQRSIPRYQGFQPQHGLRAVQGKQSVEMVLAFQYAKAETFAGNPTGTERGSAPLGCAPKAYFDGVLAAAGVPLAPNYNVVAPPNHYWAPPVCAAALLSLVLLVFVYFYLWRHLVQSALAPQLTQAHHERNTEPSA